MAIHAVLASTPCSMTIARGVLVLRPDAHGNAAWGADLRWPSATRAASPADRRPRNTIDTNSKVREILQPAEQRVEPKPCAPVLDAVDEREAPESWVECLLSLTGTDIRRCPRCQHGRMLLAPLQVVNVPAREDSS